MRTLVLLVSMTLAIFLLPSLANAWDEGIHRFGLTEDQIVDDFLHIAISPGKSWREPPVEGKFADTEMATVLAQRVQEVQTRGINRPWYYEYVAREKGLPERGRIIKWNKPVVIGLGEPEEPALAIKPIADIYTDYPTKPDRFGFAPYVAVETQIKAMTADLSEVAGLDVSYLPSRAADKVNVHVVLDTVGFSGVNFFQWMPRWSHDRNAVQLMLRGKVYFTPDAPAQVDGYLLLDDKGQIDRAVCHIYKYHTSDLIRALVGECLLRAMGLVQTSLYVPNALASRWNESNEKWMRPFSDCSDCTEAKNTNEYYLPLIASDNVNSEKFFYTYGELAKRTDYDRLRFAMTGYDRWLLQVLYSPELTVGMTPEQAREAVHMISSKIINIGHQ